VNEISFSSEEPLKLELKSFLDSVKNRSKPLADGQAGWEALKIVEACYGSSRSGGRIEIDWKAYDSKERS
jgi:predicted dehydrogenase